MNAIYKGTVPCSLFVMGINFMHPSLRVLIMPHGLLYGQVIEVQTSMHSYTLVFFHA